MNRSRALEEVVNDKPVASAPQSVVDGFCPARATASGPGTRQTGDVTYLRRATGVSAQGVAASFVMARLLTTACCHHRLWVSSQKLLARSTRLLSSLIITIGKKNGTSSCYRVGVDYAFYAGCRYLKE